MTDGHVLEQKRTGYNTLCVNQRNYQERLVKGADGKWVKRSKKNNDVSVAAGFVCGCCGFY